MVPQPKRELELNCFIQGDRVHEIFMVRISPSEAVHDLKKAIQRERKDLFEEINAVKLMLWKTLIPIDGSFDQAILDANFTHEDCLLTVPLSDVFPVLPPPRHVHVVVAKGQRSSFSPQHSCSDQLLPLRINLDDFGQLCRYELSAIERTHGAEEPRLVDNLAELRGLRVDNYNRLPNEPPSQLGLPARFFELQGRFTGPAFHFERPLSATHDIPPTLLHPIFGEFLDNCATHPPTREDNMLAYDLRSGMSKRFGQESDRVNMFVKILSKHGIQTQGSDISNHRATYKTDSDMQINDFRFVIVEYKNEIGATGAEPLLQGIWYYQRSVGGDKMQLAKYTNSTLPCLLLYAFGSSRLLVTLMCLLILMAVGAHIGFAAAAYTDRPHVQVLSSPLPLFYHHTDTKLQLTVARHFGALRRAIARLRRYYEVDLPSLSNPGVGQRDINVLFPYPSEFTFLGDSSKLPQRFTYHSKITGKLVFQATLADCRPVCVKFVRRYSREAHEECVRLQCAPVLHGFKRCPGGWFMVVMDYLDRDLYHSFDDSDQSYELYRLMKNALEKLHQAGFVHGDIRTVNTMVKNDDPSKFMLLDFDWSGKIGEVKYPPLVNTASELRRPVDAFDGQPVLAQHDLNMLDVMFPNQRYEPELDYTHSEDQDLEYE